MYVEQRRTDGEGEGEMVVWDEEEDCRRVPVIWAFRRGPLTNAIQGPVRSEFESVFLSYSCNIDIKLNTTRNRVKSWILVEYIPS